MAESVFAVAIFEHGFDGWDEAGTAGGEYEVEVFGFDAGFLFCFFDAFLHDFEGVLDDVREFVTLEFFVDGDVFDGDLDVCFEF